MRKVAAVVILLFATNAWAYRGRPVSDMRFDGRVLASYQAIASDETDFLVLTSIGPTRQEHAFAQKVVDGRAVGPQRQVGPGRATGLVWTGSNYLAAWVGLQGVFVAPVSRDGSPLSTPTAPVVFGLSGFLATNRSSALVFGYTSGSLTAQPLDLAGRETGPPITHSTPEAWESLVATAPTPDAFAMVFSSNTGTWLMLFRADGSAITSSAILLDGPGTNTTGYASSRAAVATDGTDTLIVFGAGVLGGDAELKSVVVAANGTIKSKRVLQTISVGDRMAFLPTGLVWDGSQYIAAVNVKKDQYGNDVDAALVRIARDGDRAGELTWLAERRGFQSIGHLGWNGRELALTMQDIPTAPNAELHCLTLNPSTLLPETQSVLGRTLPVQDHVTIAAGHNGYLAAWFEYADGVSTVRASRIDAAGNYLDGEGIVLDTRAGDMDSKISIDGNGPRWLVVWSNEEKVRARFVSRGGVAGVGPIAIGPGSTAAVRWDGSQYVVLHSDSSLYGSTVSLDGSVRDTKTLAAFERIDEPGGGWRWVYYLEPALVRLAGRTIAVYTKVQQFCDGTSFPCRGEFTVSGLRLDAIDAAPFVIANDVWATVTATESPAGALLTWRGYGTFLPAESPESNAEPFRIETDGDEASFAFDGSDFIAAWDRWSYPHHTILSARIGMDGSTTRNLVLPVNPDEHATAPVIAASATLPPIIAFVQRHAGSDGVARAALLLVSDIEDVPAPLPAPSIVSATKNIDGTITVRWQTMQNVFGVGIELELSDGTFRPIGVASAGATTARVSTGELEGDGARVRAWNASGLSEPSSTATIVSGRRRSARQ